MEQKFYTCRHCGNIIAKIKDVGVPIMCCGQKMEELAAGAVEAAGEKHVPVYGVEGRTVKVRVGSVDHPMLPEHFIDWVFLKTDRGSQWKQLHPGEAPHAAFALTEGETVEAVYAYCNQHSLWRG